MEEFAKGFVACAIGVAMGLWTFAPILKDRGYARGVQDCQAGTPSFTVTVENGVADTTYVYPSK